MSAKLQTSSTTAHRYPSIRSGGLLILLLGVTTLIAALTAHVHPGSAVMSGLFWPGLVISIAAQLIFRRKLSYGPGTARQTRGLVSGMGLLAAGLAAAAIGLHSASSRTQWLVVLFVVGMHFLPMRATHGWRILALGVVCTALALIGLAVPALPFLAIATVDAAAKVLTGATMLAQCPTGSPTPPSPT